MSDKEKVLGAIHWLTGRQWTLGTDAGWPDLEIVIPFSQRVIDDTGVVIGRPVSSMEQGGFEVETRLTTLKLEDLVNGGEVPDIGAVWTAGPGGDSARLHVLGTDPFSWLTPHVSTHGQVTETPPRVVLQKFGDGPAETIAGDRRFGELIVSPLTVPGGTVLTRDFIQQVYTRVLHSNRFSLRWATSRAPIHIDQLFLYVIGMLVRPQTHGWSITSPGHTVNLRPLFALAGDLWMFEAHVNLAAPVTEVEIQGAELMIYAVQYRDVRRIQGRIRKRKLLLPGRYRLTVGGRTEAQPDIPWPGVRLPAPITWGHVQEFTVRYPEMLRPYIGAATVGDNRLFAPDAVLPNPSLHGIGFPIYTGYHPYVRFRVIYMKEMLGTLTARFAYEDDAHTVATQEIDPTPNPDGVTSLPAEAIAWIAIFGGTVPPDEEIVFTNPLPKSGPCAFSISFKHPTEGLIEIDRWSAYVSRFASFAEHVKLPTSAITTIYEKGGKKRVTPCAPISDPTVAPPIPEVVTIDKWFLPGSLAEIVKASGVRSDLDFFRFAQASGVRFTDPGATTDALTGLCDTVSATTLEALLDGHGRLYALWLRTPEPLDWRRVQLLEVAIRSVVQTGSCPIAHAGDFREFRLVAIPGPDSASAFLVAVVGSDPVYLPRGDYALNLMFDPALGGLPKLRPGGSPPPFDVTLKFLQPFGLDWLAEPKP